MLTYGVVDDPCGEYCKLGKSIAMEALNRFYRAMKKCFESKYLCSQTRLALTNNYKLVLIMAS